MAQKTLITSLNIDKFLFSCTSFVQFCSTPLIKNGFQKTDFPKVFVESMNKIQFLSNSDAKYKQANANWFKKLMVEFCVQVSEQGLQDPL